jgi:protein-disulfide isomerase
MEFPMIRIAFAATLAALLTVTPGLAFDMDNMTDDERATFREEIRAYLLENPEVLMEAIGVLEQREAMAQAEADKATLAAQADALYNDGVSWIGGNPEGDITIVEFLDYRCSFCRRAHPEVAELIASDGNIRRIVKEFPILGDQSVLAARFALATKMVAGDEAYKQVHDALMTLRGDVTVPSLEKMGRDLDLDVDAILTGMAAPEIEAIIAANRQLGQALGITGTPTFVMGDEMVRGYLPLDGMRAVVAEERAGG